jgi:hypothetical protein
LFACAECEPRRVRRHTRRGSITAVPLVRDLNRAAFAATRPLAITQQTMRPPPPPLPPPPSQAARRSVASRVVQQRPPPCPLLPHPRRQTHSHQQGWSSGTEYCADSENAQQRAKRSRTAVITRIGFQDCVAALRLIIFFAEDAFNFFSLTIHLIGLITPESAPSHRGQRFQRHATAQHGP